MAEQYQTANSGVRGRLPALPRSALNPSVIAAEQAYRKRSNLPLLTDEDIANLKAGEPMAWERAAAAGAAPVGAAAAPPAAAATPARAPAAPLAAAAAAPPVAPVAAAGTAPAAGISPEVAKIVAAGKKWGKSSIAAEQARRKRNQLP